MKSLVHKLHNKSSLNNNSWQLLLTAESILTNQEPKKNLVERKLLCKDEERKLETC